MIMTEGDIVSEGDVDVEEETVLRNYDYISSNLLTVNTIPPNHVFFPYNSWPFICALRSQNVSRFYRLYLSTYQIYHICRCV